jgi:hypothetical protein
MKTISDRTPCTGTTRGLLQKARITADKLVPVGKETDRRWEQGEDPSMIDSDIFFAQFRPRRDTNFTTSFPLARGDSTLPSSSARR